MIKLFLILLLSINIYANKILEINENFKNHDSSNYIYYIEDIDEILTPNKIFISDKLTLANHNQLGKSIGPFWTKLELKNNTKKVKNLAIYNSLAGMNEIDVFIYKNKRLEHTHILGDLRDQNKREFNSRYSMFKLKLEANEKVLIISKVKNYYFHNIGWVIEKENSFIQNELRKLFIFGALLGLASLFALYNLLSYKIYNEVTFVIITFGMIFAITYVFGFHGVIYQLDLGINLALITALTWNISILYCMFLVLFPFYFFNIKEKYPKLIYYLKFKILCLLMIIAMTLYAQFFNEEYFWITKVINVFIIITLTSLLCIGIYMYFRKEIGSSYYLFGQGILLISIIIHILNILNMIPYTETNKYLFPIGITFDLIFLTIAQYIKTKNKLSILEKKKELLLEQSRFSSIGQAIGHITHQWKHPLTKLGTSITLLETIHHHQKENLIQSFDNQLPSIKNDIDLMKKTLDEFSKYYSSNISKNDFSLNESINNVMKILNSKITLKNVNLVINLNNVDVINEYEHIFSNIILVLINNSLDEFSEKNNNYIYIDIFISNNNYMFFYKDNAGGIKLEPIEKVFEYFVSTKKSNENQGIGLPIVKMLVEDRLHGKISLNNIENGVCFKISIPKNENL